MKLAKNVCGIANVPCNVWPQKFWIGKYFLLINWLMSLLFARKCRLQLWLYYPFQILSHSHSKHFIFHEEENASTWHGKAADDFDSVIDRIIVSWVWCITYIFCALALTKYRRWIGQKECVYREKIPSLTSWVLLEIGALLILTPISFRLPNTNLLLKTCQKLKCSELI